MARKQKRLYRNPKAPKFDLSAPRKKFYVSTNACIFIADENGVTRKYDGRRELLDPEGGWTKEDRAVMLTEEMANFYGNLGYIEVELDFGVEKDAEIRKLAAKSISDAEKIEKLQARLAELERGGSSYIQASEQDAADATVSALISEGTDGRAAEDAAEDGAGGDADSRGAKSSGGPSSEPVAETADASRKRRRKAL